MSDAVDKAQAREEELRSDALADQARRRCKSWPDDDGKAMTCRLCDEEIPAARRQALPGVQTCIECQEELEHANRGI